MIILYIENDTQISRFFCKLFDAHDFTYYHINHIDKLEAFFLDNPELKEAEFKNIVLLSNARVNDQDSFSYTAYIRRKFCLDIPIIIYAQDNIIKLAMRAKRSDVTQFLALPVLPLELIESIQDAFAAFQKPKKAVSPVQINMQRTRIIESNNKSASLSSEVLSIKKKYPEIGEIIKEYLDDFYAKYPKDRPLNDLYNQLLAEIEPQIIISSLEYTQHNQLKAADILGINRNTLRKKIQKYKII